MVLKSLKPEASAQSRRWPTRVRNSRGVAVKRISMIRFAESSL